MRLCYFFAVLNPPFASQVNNGGRFIVGTEDSPFPWKATITLEGGRDSYEIPVFGAKVIAVRDSLIDMHGLPSVAWTRLAETAYAGNNTLRLLEPCDWSVGDEIFVTSTGFSQHETEPLTIAAVRDDGRLLELTRNLYYDHWGDGYEDPLTGEQLMPEMRAEVGRLTRNIVIQARDAVTARALACYAAVARAAHVTCPQCVRMPRAGRRWLEERAVSTRLPRRAPSRSP